MDHFSGCQLCTQQSKDKGAYRECEAEFLRSYEFASGALRELDPPPAPRNATHFKQLAATPYCLVPSLLSPTCLFSSYCAALCSSAAGRRAACLVSACHSLSLGCVHSPSCSAMHLLMNCLR